MKINVVNKHPLPEHATIGFSLDLEPTLTGL